jgi:hypothetical protein
MSTSIVPAARAVERYVEPINRWAQARGLTPALVAGIIVQESAGPFVLPDGSANPYAFRPEPGFFNRYLPGLKALVARTADKSDDRWFGYSQVFSGSYGLMQIMYPVALERGFVFKFPHELCDPERNIEVGTGHLAYLRTRLANPSETATLLSWNGGGDPTYPAKVLAHMRAIEAARVLG